MAYDGENGWVLTNPPDDIEEEPIRCCDGCGRDLYEGDRYIENDEGCVACEYCIDDMQAKAFMYWMGIEFGTISEN